MFIYEKIKLNFYSLNVLFCKNFYNVKHKSYWLINISVILEESAVQDLVNTNSIVQDGMKNVLIL